MSSSSFVSKDSFGAGTAVDAALHPNKSFSIIFRGARTLDLMMPSDNRDDMLDALDLVLRAYQAAKVTVAKDVLLLRYIWLDVDKVRLIVCAVVARIGIACHVKISGARIRCF
jgi:hypothetical protein